MFKKLGIFIIIIIAQNLSAQNFVNYGDGLNIRTFYHQQGINYYLTTGDSNGNIYGIYYDTVSSGFNFGNEFSSIRLQVFNGITWLYTKPLKLYSKHSIDAPRILDIEWVNGKVWISGSFDSSENNLGSGVMVYNGKDWENANVNLQQTFKDYFEVRQILTVNNKILLTGNFDSIPGVKCNGLAYFDGNAWGQIGNSEPFGFNHVSNINNVFFKQVNDSIYAYNKNKIAPDSFDISNRTYRKIAVLRGNQFEQINFPYSHVGGLSSFQNKLIVLPTSNLIYISRISVFSGSNWTNYVLPDSFYSTNYVGSFEQNNLVFLIFQNPSLAQINVYKFNGNKIEQLKSFKISNQYINIEFRDAPFAKTIAGLISEIKVGNYSHQTNKIFGLKYTPQTIVHGKTFEDLNNDGTQQGNEKILKNCKVYDSQNKYLTNSNENGMYELVLPLGQTYSLSSNNDFGFETITKNTISNTIDSIYNLNLGLNKLNVNDVSIKIVGHTANKAKQGFTTRYEVNINNQTSKQYNGNVSVGHQIKISNLKFENFNIINQSKGHFTTLVQIAANTNLKLMFSCVYGVDSFLLDEQVKISAKIDVFDAKTSNNFDTLNQIVVSAFDPNIKVAMPNELVNIEKEINYIIWFQNEGNDTALNVCVVDSFGSLFSLKDIHITGDSKGGSIIPTVKNNSLIWNFKNIQLPPKATDSSNSIGFVSFRTKLNNQAKIGDTIYNKASIYFDYQKPVITNNAKVYFSKNIQVQRYNNFSNFKFSPNPNNGIVYYEIANKLPLFFELYNLEGKLIFHIDLQDSKGEFELPDDISNGIYFIKAGGEINQNQVLVLNR